ncbi:hypothetical protein HDV03_005552 [Kappamyces sp. JEL0829]|nr:hypothetical protein HDV03_005552 [Kappamyces sp. JEL0829]
MRWNPLFSVLVCAAASAASAVNVFQDLYAEPSVRVLFGIAAETEDMEATPWLRHQVGPSEWLECKWTSSVPANPPMPSTKVDEFDTKEEALDSAVSMIRDLDCMSYVNNWNYTFCEGEIVQRFSSQLLELMEQGDTLKPGMIQRMKSIEYLVGSEPEGNSFVMFPRADGSHYLRQTFDKGSYCSEISHPRETIINYSCGPKDRIVSVVEYATCLYRMNVQVKGLCQNSYFIPHLPTTAVQTAACRIVMPSKQLYPLGPFAYEV